MFFSFGLIFLFFRIFRIVFLKTEFGVVCLSRIRGLFGFGEIGWDVVVWEVSWFLVW